MVDDETIGGRSFLRRWSQRKLAASRESQAAEVARPPLATPTAEPVAIARAPEASTEPEPLPPIETLTADSDFRAFLKPDVDEGLRRQALKKLFSDPRFNVMDGLDVYIDDYNKFEPIPPELVAKLNQARYLFAPPKTRVNEEGYVADVIDESTDASAEQADEEKRDEPAALPGVGDATVASTTIANDDHARSERGAADS
ncbi:MAG TPA: DUF3306 domain-containing protein [Casimicrobiaceae bacterium]|nr:DUF3306 domain-containing protein [Casimicrobiaceae bacterium]